jgi:MFS superfamily sulfate permease-like transporter
MKAWLKGGLWGIGIGFLANLYMIIYFGDFIYVFLYLSLPISLIIYKSFSGYISIIICAITILVYSFIIGALIGGIVSIINLAIRIIMPKIKFLHKVLNKKIRKLEGK